MFSITCMLFDDTFMLKSDRVLMFPPLKPVRETTLLPTRFDSFAASIKFSEFPLPEIINSISLSVDKTISGNSGIQDFIEFVICLKLTEYEPSYISYGSMNNVNVNQEIG